MPPKRKAKSNAKKATSKKSKPNTESASEVPREKPKYSMDRLFPSKIREEYTPTEEETASALLELYVLKIPDAGLDTTSRVIIEFTADDLNSHRVSLPYRCNQPGEMIKDIPPEDREYSRGTIGRSIKTDPVFEEAFKQEGYNKSLPVTVAPILTKEEEKEYLKEPDLFMVQICRSKAWFVDPNRSYWIVDGANRTTLCKRYKFDFTAAVVHPKICYCVAERICIGVNEGSSHVHNATSFMDKLDKVREWDGDGISQDAMAGRAKSWGGRGSISWLCQCATSLSLTEDIADFAQVESQRPLHMQFWRYELFMSPFFKDMQSRAITACHREWYSGQPFHMTETNMKQHESFGVYLKKVKWGERLIGMFDLFNSMTKVSGKESTDRMWGGKKIKAGTSQQRFVAMYWCRHVLYDKVFEYAKSKEAKAKRKWTDILDAIKLILDGGEQGQDKLILEHVPMKHTSSLKPTMASEGLQQTFQKYIQANAKLFEQVAPPKDTSADLVSLEDLRKYTRFLTGDSTDQSTWQKIRNAANALCSGARWLCITSPPWGVLKKGRSASTVTEETSHDTPLSEEQIKTFAECLRFHSPDDTVCCLHLPLDQVQLYKTCFSVCGWDIHTYPIVFVDNGLQRGKNLGERLPMNNTNHYYIFTKNNHDGFKTMAALVQYVLLLAFVLIVFLRPTIRRRRR